MMAPNSWILSTKTFQRPLRLANSTTSVMISISHPPNSSSILIQVHDIQNVSLEDEKAILKQVGRMLRISEGDERNVREFQSMHPEAKKKGFGRLFRSPTLFEDAVKSILLCNCKWTRTLDMARALCELQAELADGWNSENIVKHPKKKGIKRKKFARKQSKVNKCVDQSCSNSQLLEGNNNKVKALGNFPSSKELATLTEGYLEKRCKLGYRACQIFELAERAEEGKLKLKLKKTSSYEEIYDKLSKIKGFGPYACATLMMCIGFYQVVPMDTETKRHLQQVHKTKKENAKEDVKRIYDKYAPFQALSFWLELLEYYEIKFGKLSMLPNSSYHIVTGS
ncbi:uncharacterized protein LOC112013320 isoform X2 [Quercus suber]|uniref:uncharacterized protein LOC112013320 isoform X2 n=1 Tax=Quercus suber TaxID=58331 RepID=UPI0032DF3F7D